MAIETSDAVDTCGSMKTGRIHTIVNVDTTVGPFPTVDTDTRIAAVRIGAGGTVLADGRSQSTFVHVLFAKFTGIVSRTFAAIRIDGIDAGATVLAMMARAIVDVLLTVNALEACKNEYTKETVMN